MAAAIPPPIPPLNIPEGHPLAKGIPVKYICPVTRKIMLNPVTSVACGHVFDVGAMYQKMQKCPHDKILISKGQFIPNPALKKEIEQYIRQNPGSFENKSYEVLTKERLKEKVAIDPFEGAKQFSEAVLKKVDRVEGSLSVRLAPERFKIQLPINPRSPKN